MTRLNDAIIGLTNNSLKMLSIIGHPINSNSAKDITEALKYNKSLKFLELRWNKIGSTGAKYIAEALEVNDFLEILYIECNQIGDDGARYIAKALKVNKSITTIYLGINGIGDDGAKYIAEALEENKSLTTLSLGVNGIRDVVTKYMVEVLRVNSFLPSLCLDNSSLSILSLSIDETSDITTLPEIFIINQIGDDGAKYIAEALKVNISIKTIDFEGNKFTKDSSKTLLEVWKDNMNIKSIKGLNVEHINTDELYEDFEQSKTKVQKYHFAKIITTIFNTQEDHRNKDNFSTALDFVKDYEDKAQPKVIEKLFVLSKDISKFVKYSHYEPEYVGIIAEMSTKNELINAKMTLNDLLKQSVDYNLELVGESDIISSTSILN